MPVKTRKMKINVKGKSKSSNNSKTEGKGKSKGKSRGKNGKNNKTKGKKKRKLQFECAICLKKIDLRDMRNVFSGVNCIHIFHSDCIKQHCEINNNYFCECPLCRRLLLQDESKKNVSPLRQPSLSPISPNQSNSRTIIINRSPDMNTQPAPEYSFDSPPARLSLEDLITSSLNRSLSL
jgi:hypothetical protein